MRSQRGCEHVEEYVSDIEDCR